MCVIITLQPGASFPKDKFANAVYNNWHSWGLVLKDGNGRTQLLRDCPEGGNDPEVIYKLLEDNKDIHRFLHLRHNTKGATSMENTQPFVPYSSNSREVYFFHNGTLHSFGESGNSGKSDTLDFCEKILTPAFANIDAGNGRGDYSNKFFLNQIFDKNFNSTSTGLFVSGGKDHIDTLRIGGGWSQWKQADGEPEIWVSNTSYFDTVTRGPEHDRRKEQERTERESRFRETFKTTPQGEKTAKIREFNKTSLYSDPEVILALKEVWKDNDLETPEGFAKLAFITEQEFADYAKSSVEQQEEYCVGAMFNKAVCYLYDALTEKKKLETDLTRCRERIRRNVELMKEKGISVE